MELAKSLNRLGTETAFSVLAEAKKLEAQGNPMIHLGLGQPDFKTPKHVVEAAKKALDDGHHGYVMSNGIPECRQAVTRWIKKRYSVDVDFERILIMPGGKPTMTYAIQCFGEPGAEIIHPTPAFPIYESMINYTGSTAVPYDLTEDKDLKFNPEKILSLIVNIFVPFGPVKVKFDPSIFTEESFGIIIFFLPILDIKIPCKLFHRQLFVFLHLYQSSLLLELTQSQFPNHYLF